MAQSLPFVNTPNRIQKLFERILEAKAPDGAFTHAFLRDTIGLKSTNDRAFIPLLRKMGFLDSTNKPSQSYALLRNKSTAPGAIAAGVKAAYEPLFAANVKANELQAGDLKGVVAQVTGSDEDISGRVAGTFLALAKQGNFKAIAKTEAVSSSDTQTDSDSSNQKDQGSFRPEFHYNIQVHLPSNGSEETYLNIFTALKKTFS